MYCGHANYHAAVKTSLLQSYKCIDKSLEKSTLLLHYCFIYIVSHRLPHEQYTVDIIEKMLICILSHWNHTFSWNKTQEN